jgi:hypothetical protein
MLGYYKTLPTSIGSFHSNPNITNYVIKNGIIANTEERILDTDLNIQAYATDTEFLGSELYARQYNEVGFSINTLNESWIDKLGFSAKYIFSVTGAKVDGFRIGLGYQF